MESALINKNLENALNEAFQQALQQNHAYLTLEHLLYAILQTEEGIDILLSVGVDLDELGNDLEEYMAGIEPLGEENDHPVQTMSLQRILQVAIIHVQSSEKKELEIADVLVALFDEEDSYARYFLEKQDVSRLDVLNYVSHGVEKIPDYNPFDDMPPEFDDDPGFHEGSEKRGQDLLEKYTVNMTVEAFNGKYDELIGREKELQRTIEILCRRRKNNPIHVGDPGVGKTAITQGLAQRIVDGDIPTRLKGYEIYSIDMGSMLAGTKFRGDFEERLKGVFHAIKKLERAIVFIDEIHTIVGAGSASGGSMDASNLLKPFLTGEFIRVIGSTTHEEYRQHFEKDRALTRRFQKIDIAEPNVEDTYKIIDGLKKRYEDYHQVKYSRKAARACVDLSDKYIRERHLPDKAIDIMDEAGASVSIYHPQRRVVSVSDIEKLVARVARIPVQAVSQSEKADLQDIEKNLNKVVYGQQKAISIITRAVKRHRAGLGNDNKPIGSFLFVGPTGVGKTELARQLSSELGVELIRFDMSEYMEKHSISRLLGSPPGYVGFDQGAQLTDSIRKNPHAVLLLDEIEKAHPDIFNALLQVMDHATITDSTGKSADFRNVVLIMTSNAGSRDMSTQRIGFGEEGGRMGDPMREIKNMFTPEFRNRLDHIVFFKHLQKETINKIVKKFIHQLEQQLRSKKLRIELTDSALEYLAQKGYDPAYGARPMARVIQEQVKDPLVEELLFGEFGKKGVVEIDYKPDAEKNKNSKDDTEENQPLTFNFKKD